MLFKLQVPLITLEAMSKYGNFIAWLHQVPLFMNNSISIRVFSNVKQFKSGVYECLKKSKIGHSSTCTSSIWTGHPYMVGCIHYHIWLRAPLY